MTKVDFIARYGEESYEKLLAQQREYNITHKEEAKAYNRKYRGVALVEADQHMHGFVDVIQILNGKITHLTEEQICNGGA